MILFYHMPRVLSIHVSPSGFIIFQETLNNPGFRGKSLGFLRFFRENDLESMFPLFGVSLDKKQRHMI